MTVRKRDDHPRGAGDNSHRAGRRPARAAHAGGGEPVCDARAAAGGHQPVRVPGGRGRRRRCEPLSYDALAKLFARRMGALGLRTAETTAHALRHTHATAMWEGGMRETVAAKEARPRISGVGEGLYRSPTRLSWPTTPARWRTTGDPAGRRRGRAARAATMPCGRRGVFTWLDDVFNGGIRARVRPVRRDQLRRYFYDRFVRRWPDLEEWFAAPADRLDLGADGAPVLSAAGKRTGPPTTQARTWSTCR